MKSLRESLLNERNNGEVEDVLNDMIDKLNLVYNSKTLSYDCDGDVKIYKYRNELNPTEQKKFDKAFVRNGKMTIRFGVVKGDFYLPGDDDEPYILTSLEGCPKSVGGNFNCSYNQLTSLEGCPKSVGGYFYCNYNNLTSLEGCPKSVGGYFNCSYNNLTSLEGCPKSVGGSFYCSYNNLTSLEGCPKSVGGGFICHNNQLTSLEGCPKSVGGEFICHNNQLTSLEGCPKSVGGEFDCGKQTDEKVFTEKDIPVGCNIKGRIYFE